jgi:hypothetical protein
VSNALVTTVSLQAIKSTVCFWAKINCGRNKRIETKNKMFSFSIAEFTTTLYEKSIYQNYSSEK